MGQDTTDISPLLLMDAARVNRTINRLAYQITEDNREETDILIIGMKQRGYVLAKVLAECLTALSGKEITVEQFSMDQDFNSLVQKFKYVVLVDDVIFSGRTMFEALNTLLTDGNPDKIRTAVLIDRGHRSVPVEATFVGLPLPTKLKEHVRVITGDNAIKKVVLNHSSV